MSLINVTLHFKTGIPVITAQIAETEADSFIGALVKESKSKTPGLVKVVDHEGDEVWVAADHVASIHPEKVGK